jgi:hypothetical protein
MVFRGRNNSTAVIQSIAVNSSSLLNSHFALSFSVLLFCSSCTVQCVDLLALTIAAWRWTDIHYQCFKGENPVSNLQTTHTSTMACADVHVHPLFLAAIPAPNGGVTVPIFAKIWSFPHPHSHSRPSEWGTDALSIIRPSVLPRKKCMPHKLSMKAGRWLVPESNTLFWVCAHSIRIEYSKNMCCTHNGLVGQSATIPSQLLLLTPSRLEC